MNTTQKIYTALFWVIIVLLAYIVVLQPKANASEKIQELELEKQQLIEENKQLAIDKQEESDAWWVDEEAKNECIKSFEDLQNKRNQNNTIRENQITINSWRIEIIDKELGLLMQSQLQ